MWNYVKRYLLYAALAALFMVGEVSMDLVQPEIMSNIHCPPICFIRRTADIPHALQFCNHFTNRSKDSGYCSYRIRKDCGRRGKYAKEKEA